MSGLGSKQAFVAVNCRAAFGCLRAGSLDGRVWQQPLLTKDRARVTRVQVTSVTVRVCKRFRYEPLGRPIRQRSPHSSEISHLDAPTEATWTQRALLVRK